MHANVAAPLTAAPLIATPEARSARRRAWILVTLFVFFLNGAGVLCWLAEAEISAAVTLLFRALSIVVFWQWLEAECRPYRVAFPFDMGFLLYASNFVVLPYYLWRTQRWRGVGKLILVAVLWAVSLAFWQAAAWLATIARSGS